MLWRLVDAERPHPEFARNCTPARTQLCTHTKPRAWHSRGGVSRREQFRSHCYMNICISLCNARCRSWHIAIWSSRSDTINVPETVQHLRQRPNCSPPPPTTSTHMYNTRTAMYTYIARPLVSIATWNPRRNQALPFGLGKLPRLSLSL